VYDGFCFCTLNVAVRATGRSGREMYQDGLYELSYRSPTASGNDADSLLMVLRDGKILGSDRWGGVFLGSCVFDDNANQSTISVRLQIPPGGMLITDSIPRPDGDVIDIVFTLSEDGELNTGSAVVDVGGEPVMIEFVYKGPVPG
jgi:hypothetical protein